jgi:hypothetical protein
METTRVYVNHSTPASLIYNTKDIPSTTVWLKYFEVSEFETLIPYSDSNLILPSNNLRGTFYIREDEISDLKDTTFTIISIDEQVNELRVNECLVERSRIPAYTNIIRGVLEVDFRAGSFMLAKPKDSIELENRIISNPCGSIPIKNIEKKKRTRAEIILETIRKRHE